MSTITLPNIRVGSDLQVRVRLKDGGVAIDWSTLSNIKACIYSDAQRALAGRCDVSVDAEDPTVLVCQYAANKPQYVGVCRIVVSAKYMGETKTYDKPAFNFVRWTADQDGEQITIDDPDVDVEIEVSDVSSSLLDEAIRAAFTAAEEAVDAKGQVLETEAEVEAAEALRVSAEESRVEAEEGRAEAEAARVDEEAVRVSAEDARVVAENARAAAEDLREGAEDDRAAAETARETAEAARVAAEALRVTAEGSRETAETAREAQASADHTTAASDHTQAAADHTQAAADHTTAASDHTQAGADHTLAAADHVTAGEDHAQAQDDHEVMAGYDTRLGNVEGEVSQLEAKVNGATVVTNIEKDATTSNLRIASTGGTSTASAETSSVTCFPVDAGKTYTLTIPKVKNQYQIAYGFYTAAITSAAHIVTQPDPVILGPVTNGVYQVTIPSGMNHLIVSHETADGLPTLVYTTISTGIVDDINELDTRVDALESDAEQLNEDMYGGTTLETVQQASVTNNIRIANTGRTANGMDSTPDCATASYQIPAGTSVHIEIPGLTSNQYTVVYGFANLPNTTAGYTVNLPSTPVVGPVSNGEYDIVIPDGYSYLLVCYTTTAGTPSVEKQVTDAGVKADVQTLKEEVENINAGTVEISLPDKYVAVVGDVLQIFRRGVIKATNPYNYNVLFTCSKGANFPRYWRVYPTAVGDVGTYPITVTITDNLGKTIAQAQSELEIVASPSSPASSKKFVCFGASTTYPGKWPAEAYRRLTGTGGTPAGKGLSNIAFCGPMTKDGAGYFGVGGWSWANYISAGSPAFRFQVSGVSELYLGAKYTNNGHTYTILEVNVTSGTGNILCSTSSASNTPTASGTLTKSTGDGDATITFSSATADAANPFWNYNTNALDFQGFADTYCGGSIDCLIPLLGWNERTKYETGFTMTKQNIRTLIDAFHADFPSAKVLLLGINCPSPIGGMGANYGSNHDYSDWYGMTVSALNLKKAYQEIANEDDYSGFVSFVDIAGQFDSDYNLPKEEQGVNIRNTEQTEWLGTNGVHPSDAGYGQIADAVYRAIVDKYCQS